MHGFFLQGEGLLGISLGFGVSDSYLSIRIIVRLPNKYVGEPVV